MAAHLKAVGQATYVVALLLVITLLINIGSVTRIARASVRFLDGAWIDAPVEHALKTAPWHEVPKTDLVMLPRDLSPRREPSLPDFGEGYVAPAWGFFWAVLCGIYFLSRCSPGTEILAMLNTSLR